MRILVVEDEQRMARAIAHGLGRHGFVVETAHDGVTGHWMATESDYDAILLDIMMSKLSGYDVCKRLRAERNWTPILMLTAKDGPHDEADALDLGADDYLRKPFSLVVLVARIHALLRRGSPQRPAALVARDVVLDPAKRTVVRSGRPVELTPREFSVLECLVRNAGQIRTKRQLLDHVWGSDFDRDPNIVEVYVGYLRRKLDRTGETPVIMTVRGHGYLVHDDAP